MNVLFLVMEFAPVNTTGNFRSLKFVKYLKDFGINPIVITLVEEDGARIFDAPVNKELLTEIPEGTFVYRIKCRTINRDYKNRIAEFADIYFSLVDGIGKAWENNLFRELGDIVQLHQPELIYTSMPPFSCGRLAKKIAKKYQLPFVADMRDLWAYWGSNPNGSYFHFLLKKAQERSVFKSAAKIIGVTPQLIEVFRKAHPGINTDKFEWIPNGYDDNLIKKSVDLNLLADKFIIGYIGSFYYNPVAHQNAIIPWWKRKGHRKLHYFPVKENWLYRSPYFFFSALHNLFRQHPMLKNRIRFSFVGREPDWLQNMLKEFDLQDIYQYHGFRTHQETLRIQNSFSAFLATSEKVEGGEHYCLPSKVFDYVQKQKPILAFVTPGVQKDFLSTSGLAIICDPDNPRDSALKIENLINGKYTQSLNLQYLKQYHRKAIAKKLAEVLKEVVGKVQSETKF